MDSANINNNLIFIAHTDMIIDKFTVLYFKKEVHNL